MAVQCESLGAECEKLITCTLILRCILYGLLCINSLLNGTQRIEPEGP